MSMKKIWPWLAATLVLSLVGHLLIVAEMPAIVNFGWLKLLHSAGMNANELSNATHAKLAGRDIVGYDNPDNISSFLIYDVSKSPLRIHVPVIRDAAYWSISAVDYSTDVFFLLRDADLTGNDATIVIVGKGQSYKPRPGERVAVAPTSQGVVLIRAIVQNRYDVKQVAHIVAEKAAGYAEAVHADHGRILGPAKQSAAAEKLLPPDAVSLKAKLAYALPGLPLQVLHFAALAILPTFYAKHTSVSVLAIGLTLLATRIFDAVFHPLVGFVSDRFILATGGRKPWIVVGSVLCAISAYAVFTPSPSAGAGYFLFWSVALFGSWTVLEIPHRAWGTELTRDYFERSRVFAVLAQFRMVGSILFLGAPLLPYFASSDITRPQFLAMAALVLAVVFPVSSLVAVVGAPNGKIVATNKSTMRGLVQSIARNKPLWIFAGVFALSGIGSGLYNSDCCCTSATI